MIDTLTNRSTCYPFDGCFGTSTLRRGSGASGQADAPNKSGRKPYAAVDQQFLLGASACPEAPLPLLKVLVPKHPTHQLSCAPTIQVTRTSARTIRISAMEPTNSYRLNVFKYLGWKENQAQHSTELGCLALHLIQGSQTDRRIAFKGIFDVGGISPITEVAKIIFFTFKGSRVSLWQDLWLLTRVAKTYRCTTLLLVKVNIRAVIVNDVEVRIHSILRFYGIDEGAADNESLAAQMLHMHMSVSNKSPNQSHGAEPAATMVDLRLGLSFVRKKLGDTKHDLGSTELKRFECLGISEARHGRVSKHESSIKLPMALSFPENG
ncbi:hypothetical protein HD806DRAFT_550197 [Xylariaceae sp. AK1471]|nr:hypothetical protein HD806DRAFT_550197 [Xylariaceae sp. AK1471]